MRTKTLSIIIALTMIVSLFAACENHEESTPTTQTVPTSSTTSENSESTSALTPEDVINPDAFTSGDAETIKLPLSNDMVIFTEWGATPNSSAGMIDQNDSVARQELERRTNVRVEWSHPTTGQEQTQFNLMIASQTYTDTIITGTGYYIGGIDKFIDDDILIDLAPYTEYMKNYMLRRSIDDEGLRMTVTDKGRLIGFQDIKASWQMSYGGYGIRTDWMEDLGYTRETLQTYDQWEAFLTDVQVQKGADYPLLPNDWGTNGRFGGLMNGFGLGGTGFYQVDGVVKYAPYESAFKDYLQLATDWYSKGLIDRDFYTRTFSDRESFLLNGRSAIGFLMYIDIDRFDLQTADNGKWSAIEVPRLTEDSIRTHFFTNSSTTATNNPTTFTTALSEDMIPIVCRYFDYQYTEEGALLANYGIEGETFYFDENGDPYLMDFITNNPEGLSISAGLHKYTLAHQTTSMWYFWDREIPPTMSDKARYESGEIWDEHVSDNAQANKLPTLNVDESVLAEYTAAYNDIDTFVNEWVVRAITGEVSLDSYETEFIPELEKLGVKNCIQWQQDALDRYYQRDITVGY